MAAIRPNENVGWFPRSSRAREVRLREDSAAMLRGGYLLLACKEREKASRKTAQGAVSLPGSDELQAGLRPAGISCRHGPGPHRTHLHRDRSEPGDRCRDRAAIVRRARVGAARGSRGGRAPGRRGAMPRGRRQGRRAGLRRDGTGCRGADEERRRGAVRAGRRARQQRGHGALARHRRRSRRGLAGRLGAERDGLAARNARRRAGHARAPMGAGRERLEHRRQAAVRPDARVLGREGCAALAVAALRGPLRRGRRARERDLPRSDQVRAVVGGGRPGGAVGGTRRRRSERRHSSGRPPDVRSSASPRSTRSQRRSSSCARSARPT